MKTDKPVKTFRVFVTRHYIAVERFDIKETTVRRARTKAKKAAYKVRPNPRAEATDNGWIPDDGIEIPRVGSYGEGGRYTDKTLVEVVPGVFHSP